MKTLLIVESPAKSKTIEKLLGPNYVVCASMGHIRDLDKKKLGIDIDHQFCPNYKILPEKVKQIKQIREIISKVDRVLLAADEDREGEAIAWHCAIVFQLDIKAANRICFHEITSSALEYAVSHPRPIHMDMVYSQQARRILDRLVGFTLSPLLWKNICPKLSAGRVQSSALKLIIDFETSRELFITNKSYQTKGYFNKKIEALLDHVFEKEEEIRLFLEDCIVATFTIKEIQSYPFEKKPPPPFITSTIQQEMYSRFGLSSKQTMSILQKLYEHGMISYHRTDSTNLSTYIQEELKKQIIHMYGKEYVHGRIYTSKIKCAQEAHEAIRPTHIDIVCLNDSFHDLEKKVYSILWKRTMASQMSAYLSDKYKIYITISNRTEQFIASAEKILFDGYTKLYDVIANDISVEDDFSSCISSCIVDSLQSGEILLYQHIDSIEKYKPPPPRYNESSFIKKMEKIGIGRPSTYSNTVETIFERGYAEKKDIVGEVKEVHKYELNMNQIKYSLEKITIGAEKKKIVPTELGKKTHAFLHTYFQTMLEPSFTSTLEQKLDQIANHQIEWTTVIQDFYSTMMPQVQLSQQTLFHKTKRCLGKREDGQHVYVYIGKYGPVAQIGEDSSCTYQKIEHTYNIDTITLQDLTCLNSPILGYYDEKEIVIKNGKYGSYLFYNQQNYKIKEEWKENITIEQAIECIKDAMPRLKIGKYVIRNGPYGPYIQYGKKCYGIPKEYKIESLTKEICEKIIKLPKKKDGFKSKST